MPAGRPTKYDLETADRICEGIASGKSLVSVCSDEGMPKPRTVYQWLREHDEFQQMYTRAKDDMADLMSEQTLEVADDPSLEPNDKRVRVDTRKWLASKLKPKKYGDKVQQEVSGPGGGPVQSDTRWTVEFVNPSNRDNDHKTEDENDAR